MVEPEETAFDLLITYEALAKAIELALTARAQHITDSLKQHARAKGLRPLPDLST
jgi:hypothetical protein